MFLLSFLSCRLFLFTYAQSFFTTSVRGSGLSPTIFASAGLGCMAFMKAAFGLRAVFLAVFFAAFLAAIRFSSQRGSGLPSKTARTLTEADRLRPAIFPSGTVESLLDGSLPQGDSTALRPRNPQHRCASPPQEEGERQVLRGGCGEPFPLLFLGCDHERLASRREESRGVLQLPRGDGRARRRGQLSDHEGEAAPIEPVRRKEGLARFDGEPQRACVPAEKGDFQQVSLLRHDLRRGVARLETKWESAVPRAEGEGARGSVAGQGLGERGEQVLVPGIFGGVVGSDQPQS